MFLGSIWKQADQSMQGKQESSTSPTSRFLPFLSFCPDILHWWTWWMYKPDKPFSLQLIFHPPTVTQIETSWKLNLSLFTSQMDFYLNFLLLGFILAKKAPMALEEWNMRNICFLNVLFVVKYFKLCLISLIYMYICVWLCASIYILKITMIYSLNMLWVS